MEPLLPSWPHRAAFSRSHQLVKLTLQILLGAPRFFCHPAKVDGTKEADGLFYTILWSGPGLSKVEAGNWRIYLNRVQRRANSMNLPHWQQLTATMKPINRFITKLWEVLALYWQCLTERVFDMLENTSVMFLIRLPKVLYGKIKLQICFFISFIFLD